MKQGRDFYFFHACHRLPRLGLHYPEGIRRLKHNNKIKNIFSKKLIKIIEAIPKDVFDEKIIRKYILFERVLQKLDS